MSPGAGAQAGDGCEHTHQENRAKDRHGSVILREAEAKRSVDGLGSCCRLAQLAATDRGLIDRLLVWYLSSVSTAIQSPHEACDSVAGGRAKAKNCTKNRRNLLIKLDRPKKAKKAPACCGARGRSNCSNGVRAHRCR
jgi:hypothetical protein